MTTTLESDYMSDEQEQVTITLSESLLVTNPLFSLLQNQIGGNKVKVIQLNFTWSDKIPNIPLRQFKTSCIATCPEQNLIYYGYASECQVFDLENKKLQKKFEFPCDKLKFFQVDSLAEYAYLRCDDYLIKCQLDNLSIVWKYSNRKAYSSFVLCEAKNEIYLFDTKIIVLNSLDGSLKRQINIECNYYQHLQLISYDLKEEKFYLTFCTEAEGNDDEDPSYCLVIHDEKSGEFHNVDVADQVIGISFSHKDYFLCWKKCKESGLDLFEKKTNKLIASKPNICSLYGRDFYFDCNHDILYFSESEKVLKIVPLYISTLIESVPINRENCLAIKRMGGKFPAIISNCNLEPICFEYFSNIDVGKNSFTFIGLHMAIKHCYLQYDLFSVNNILDLHHYDSKFNTLLSELIPKITTI